MEANASSMRPAAPQRSHRHLAQRREIPLAPTPRALHRSRPNVSASAGPDPAVTSVSDLDSRHNAGGYRLSWLDEAPRVRVRKSTERQRDYLLELAALNERLAGTQAHEARSKLEYLKMRRYNWEGIYHYITKQDAVATIAAIEDASLKVESALSEEARERSSVSELKVQLEALRQDVDAAQQKLQATQARVADNLGQIENLRAEAVALERARAMPSVGTAVDARVSTSSRTESPASTPSAAPASAKPRPMQRSAPAAAKAADARKRGLHSSLTLEPALREFWYPTEFSSKLVEGTMVPFEMFGEPWVLFRGADGQPGCLRDECAHRACPLSVGKVVDGNVQCAYHGWEFGVDGSCSKMPSTTLCKGVKVKALPCKERDGFVWIWTGNGEPPEVPSFTPPPPGFDLHAEIMVDVPVEHGLLIENLLDLAHAPFTHTSTFARGWPVPDVVKFHATRLLAGNWDPYPIGMSFQPPCMTISNIGLAQPGKIERGVKSEDCKKHLHQLHVCLPSKPGHTRLLYRMSLDFMGWIRSVPFIDQVWKAVAAQVLGEDLVLVQGQQARLLAGGDTWRNPVSYDKIAVRYRRWRNSLAAGDMAGAAEQAALSSNVSAGELFGLTTDDECAAEQCVVDE